MFQRFLSIVITMTSFCFFYPTITKEIVMVPGGLLLQAGLHTGFIASFALFLAILLLGTLLIGKLFKIVFKIPTIAGNIIGGIILGPSGINIAGYPLFKQPFLWFDDVTHIMYTFIPSDAYLFFIIVLSSVLTVAYLLWLAGYETNIKDLMKVGVTAVTAGILGAVLPIICIGGCLYFVFPSFYSVVSACGIGLVFAATSVSIPVAMLVNMQKMHLKSSQATLGAAIVDDIVAVILVSFFMMVVQMGLLGDISGTSDHALEVIHHSGGLAASLGFMGLCAVVMIAFGLFVMPVLFRFINRPTTNCFMAPMASICMLLYFACAEMMGGLAGITGAYFAGLFHRSGDRDHKAEKVIAPFVNAFLLPLFLGSIGLQINICVLSLYEWGIATLLLLLSIVSKLGACYIAAIISNYSGRRSKNRWTLREMYLFGSSMIARGEVGLVIATLLKGASIITPQAYVLCVVVIVLTTIATPIMLAFGFSDEKYDQTQILSQEYEVTIVSSDLLRSDFLLESIMHIIEKKNGIATSVSMSDGCSIVDLEGKKTRIIVHPQKGIIFEGDRAYIQGVLAQVKRELQSEINHLL